MKHTLLRIFAALSAVLVLTVLTVCGRTSPPPKEDTTPPTVISEYPSNNSINVSINTSISIGFSEKMDVAAIGPTTILVKDADSNAVQGVITCDGLTATFTPKASLDYSTTYVVAVTAEVRDVAGNNIAYPVTYVFTTGAYVDTVPPQIFSTAPTGTNVGLNAVVVVTFDEDMYPWAFTPQSIIVSNGTSTIPGQLTTYSRMVIFQPDQPLQKLTTYTIAVSGSVQDMSGNPMGQPHVWQFETGDPDHEPPYVLNSTPTGSNALVTAPIIVTFNEAMLESTITSSTMILYDTKLSTNVTGSVSAKGATAIMTPAKALQYDTDYIVTLIPGYSTSPGITDLAGNPLVANSTAGHTWTFRTEQFPNFIINATAGSGGTITPSGPVGVAYDGAKLFTIAPSTGYHIMDVLVDGVSVGAVNTYSFTNVKANHSISASFAINTYTVSITKAGTGDGSVQTSPWKDLVWLSSTATPTFDHGTTVTLTAYPGTLTAPSSFSGWSGCDSVNGVVCTITMNSAKSVTATFALSNYTLSVAKAGLGSGSVTPSTGTLIWTGSTGTASYPYNTQVTLTAAASVGSSFTGWSGEGCAGIGTCTVSVTQYRSITAAFSLNNYTVTPTAGANGTINPAGSRLVSYGSTTGFTVTPNNGYTAIMGGTCGGSPSTGTLQFSYTTNAITNDCTVTASFTVNPYILTVTKNGTGSGTVVPNSGTLAWSGSSGTATYSYGTSVILTATYDVSSTQTPVVWSGCDSVNGSACTVNINAARNVAATFALNTYTITPTAGSNGAISPSTPQIVSHGSSTIFTFTPTTGYYISSVTVDGGSVGLPTSYTFTNVTADHTVAVSFAIGSYTISATAGAGGTLATGGTIISSGTSQDFLVNHGGSRSFTITPNAGYSTTSILVDGITTMLNPYAFTNVTANHTLSAAFALNTYPVTATAGANGTISPASKLVSHGSTTTFTVTPSANYAAVMGGTCGGTLVGTTYTTNAIIAPCTVSATFTLNGYAVTPSAGANGTISPATPQTVNYGSTTVFAVTPNTGYTAVVGGTCGGTLVGNTYTTNAITAPCTVEATFTQNVYTVTAMAGANGTISPASRLVSYGSTTTFTVLPSAGYAAVVGGTCGGTLDGTTYTTAPIIGPCSVSATFTLNAYTVTATAGANGTISPASRVVGYNSTTAFTVTPNTGYSAVMGGTCGGTLTGNTYETNPIVGDCTVTATFTLNTYTVTASAGSGGAITPASLLVSHGSTTIFTIAPNTGYSIGVVGGTCGGTLVGTTYTTNAVTAPCTVTAAFTLNSYTVTTAAGSGGTITPASRLVSHGSATTFTITPNTGYAIGIVDGTCGGTLVGATYTTNAVTAPCTVTASFTLNSYTVTATSGAGGTVTPASQLVSHGSTTTFTIAPSAGYMVDVVGGTCGGTLVGTSYTTNAVTAPCTVTATFLLIPINGVCGASNTGTFPTVPTADLCGAGTATAVSGTGPWTWSCSGLYGGTTAACSANIQTYAVTTSAGSGGTIAPASRLVSHGSTTTFTITPNTGYSIGVVDGTCGGTLVGTSYTTNAVTAPCTVTATFLLNSYTVTTSAGEGGTIAPASRLVTHGSTTTFTITPNTGYSIGVVDGTCGGTLVGTSYTTNAVTAPCTVTATFILNTYTVSTSAGEGGTIAPASRLVSHGSTTTFTIAPSAGYMVDVVDGTCGGTLVGTTYTTNAVTAPCTVTATFLLIPINGVCGASNAGTFPTVPTADLCGAGTATAVSGTGPWTWSCSGLYGGTTAACSANIQTYTASTSAGSGGTIAPASRVVNHGATTTFTVNAGTGFFITSISGCGGTTFTNTDISVATYEYTTGVITADCAVTATYENVTAAVVGATQGMGFGRFGASVFLFNPALYRSLFGWRRTRKDKGRPGTGTGRSRQSRMDIAKREREP